MDKIAQQFLYKESVLQYSGKDAFHALMFTVYISFDEFFSS